MAPLTGYRIWFAENQQQRANSWMLMIASLGFLSSTLPVQLLLPAFRLEMDVWWNCGVNTN